MVVTASALRGDRRLGCVRRLGLGLTPWLRPGGPVLVGRALAAVDAVEDVVGVESVADPLRDPTWQGVAVPRERTEPTRDEDVDAAGAQCVDDGVRDIFRLNLRLRLGV